MNDDARRGAAWTLAALALLASLLAGLALAGCRASRNIDTDRRADYSGRLTAVRSWQDSLSEALTARRREVSGRLSGLSVKSRFVLLSPPDSAGRQYPVAIGTTEADSREASGSESVAGLDAVAKGAGGGVAVSAGQAEGAEQELRRVEELSWWDVHKWQVLAVVLVILAMLLVALRKVFKLRK